ncbi:hypothetical protein ODZ84_01900 [Chryseobacterium fluminis]|uniref:hypothetical protein n=1 Tax=Chryseobacterium fluminis TaxID=2983606 RepID=UPI002258446F|nr:hypothetical protein [Chryseobacterium sp. MMS21-Ot14]UZT98345.1 hypothetical protein ODZ84_01900 [Chryseobacterium sp. MMS21-Ot14]
MSEGRHNLQKKVDSINDVEYKKGWHFIWMEPKLDGFFKSVKDTKGKGIIIDESQKYHR